MKQKTAIGEKVNSLIQRPNRAELYSGSTDGKIAVFLPYRKVYEEEAEETDNQANVLDSIYRSLTQTPIEYVWRSVCSTYAVKIDIRMSKLISDTAMTS